MAQLFRFISLSALLALCLASVARTAVITSYQSDVDYSGSSFFNNFDFSTVNSAATDVVILY